MDPNIKIPVNESRVPSNSDVFPHKHNAYTILPEVHFAFCQKFLQKHILECQHSVIEGQHYHNIHSQ